MLVGVVTAAHAGLLPELVYEANFEPPLYSSGLTLTGQDQWTSFPAGATYTSQILEEAFPGLGSQAILGFAAPETNSVYSSSAYRPLQYDPVGRGRPLVGFRVTMAVFDSSPGKSRDYFRWSVYNRDAARLFSLEFDNQSTLISLQLDDDRFQSLERLFERDSLYTLEMVMNFASNVWSATLNGELIVNAAPITTKGRPLDLGDIDAVWVMPENQNVYGDNYLVFDDYRVVAAEAVPLPCEVQLTQVLANGHALLRLVGEPGRPYAIDRTEDLVHWTALVTNVPGDGTFVAEDSAALAGSGRFYRGRAIWP